MFAGPASPGKKLEMQVLGPASNLPNQKFELEFSNLCFNSHPEDSGMVLVAGLGQEKGGGGH